jgi:hypothetical protein
MSGLANLLSEQQQAIMAAMQAALADRIGSNRFDRAAGMAPAPRGAAGRSRSRQNRQP